MRAPARMHLRARQRGAVLLILLALVSVLFIYAVVAGLNRSAVDMAQARAQKTATALAQAKEALIAYAVTYADDPSHSAHLVPGFLPCPEMVATSGNEGVAAGAIDCGSALVSKLGRLPWRTLNLDALKDGSGECLWYAVSGTYKNNPNGVTTNTATSNMMNWDTNGQFNVMDTNGTSFLAGSAADNRAVAVIFAPGGALSGQSRTSVAGTAVCGGDPGSPAAYLETANGINNSAVSGSANATSTYIAGTASSTFNDQLVYITRTDIWNAIKKRSDFNDQLRALTRRAAECVALYGRNNQSPIDLADKRLPWASPTALSNYAVDSLYDDAGSDFQGRLSFRVNNSRSSTSNQVSSSTSLFAVAAYCWYTAPELDWYEHWKDHLWYALASRHRPNSGKPTAACTGATCLSVNGPGSYAAVIIFAGEKLDGKSRTVTEKGQMSSYLEGRNLSNNPNSGGNSNYEARNPLTAAFNDIIYAIDTSLPTVKCYSASSSTMVTVPAAPSSPPGPYAACP